MEIKHDSGRFYIEDNGKTAGELTYKTSSGSMDIDHTEINERFRGEGLGRDLVAAAIAYAKDNDLELSASCPYARRILDERS